MPPAGFNYLFNPQKFANQTISGNGDGDVSLLLNLPTIPVLARQAIYSQFIFRDSAWGVTHSTDVLDVCFQP